MDESDELRAAIDEALEAWKRETQIRDASHYFYKAAELAFGDNLINGVDCVTISQKAYDELRRAYDMARGKA